MIEKKTFKQEDFPKDLLTDQMFQNCSFIGYDFTEANLRNTKFSFCVFSNCNFSLPLLDNCRMQEVQFVSCKIIGADFYKCEKMFFTPSFEKCVLRYSNFSDLNLKNIFFKQSKINEVYFNQTILVGADFSGSDLLGSQFHHCDLSKADFSTAVRYQIDPQSNKIKKAKFSLPEAIGLLQGFDIEIV